MISPKKKCSIEIAQLLLKFCCKLLLLLLLKVQKEKQKETIPNFLLKISTVCLSHIFIFFPSPLT